MTYDYIITKPPLDEETLMHFGVKGMRWGHRKQQLIAGGMSKRMAKRQVRLEKKQDRLANQSSKYSKWLEGTRNKNFEKRKNKYKSRLEKYSKHHDADKVSEKRAKYNKTLNTFAQTTKDYKSAGAEHKKHINDYYKNKISALSDKSIKKTDKYKAAKRTYQAQRFYDINYGSGHPSASIGRYAYEAQKTRRRKTGAYTKNNKRYV